MTENLVRQTFAPGAQIFTDGDTGNVVYLIEQGKVELAQNLDGHRVVLAELGGGEMLGELSVIDGEPRSATATAIEDTHVIVASRAELLKQIEAADDWVQLMLRVMIDRLRDVQHGKAGNGAARPEGTGYPESLGIPEPIGASEPNDTSEADEATEAPDTINPFESVFDPVFAGSTRANVITEPVERLDGLAGELQVAIEENQLELNYQPIVSVAERYVAGFEALVRWQHPTHGTIVPSNFISLAESTGLIVPLGRWLLERALKDLKTFQGNSKRNGTTPPLYMSVNVSSRQLLSDIEIQDLGDIVRDSGASPGDLMFEITENLMIEDPDNVAAAMAEFRAMGIRIAADDFGTGYANLQFLKNFPLDMIKIDRAFISHSDIDERNRRIVETVIKLAKQFDLVTVAEGIETKGEMNLLRELNCDFAQGYLLSKPITATNALPIINQQILW
jgi:EAL domain-containing protein (putative c-di-GMP-specific phosphodiesterase class I)